MRLAIDYKLIVEAAHLAGGEYIHKVNGLLHAYCGFSELEMQPEFLEAEAALRQFVVTRRLMLLALGGASSASPTSDRG